MKRTLVTGWVVCLCATSASAQNPAADSLMVVLSRTDDDSARIDLMNRIIYDTPTLTLDQRIHYTKAMLDLSKKRGDKVLESVTTAELGYLLGSNGNTMQASELAYSALEMARHHGNLQALGIIYNDLAICMEDSARSFEYLHMGLAASEQARDPANAFSCLFNLAAKFKAAGLRDSALYYAQRSYARSQELRTLQWAQASPLALLAGIHQDMYGDRGLAREYLKKAMAVPGAMEHPDMYGWVYFTLARFQLADGRADSALYYADQCRRRSEMLRAGDEVGLYALYKLIYDTTNADSALKYYRLTEAAKARFDATRERQQTALLQMKKEIELDQQAAEREQDLQFAFIAVGILSFVLIFLLLSRSIVTGPRTIRFLSAMALLIVFEFLNLLLHPFLERVTHHSPVLMLLALVCIAALLVPLHHKLEKWATARLVEKNARIRLAKAKKTIEELEPGKA